MRSMLTSVLVPDPDSTPARRAGRRGAGDRRGRRRCRADRLGASWPGAWRCGSSTTSTSAPPPVLDRRARGPPQRQRPARADGDAVRRQRPARAGPGRRAPGDARRVPRPGRRAAPPAVRGVRPASSRPSHALSAGDYDEAQRLADEALATGRPSHGVNAEIAYAGVRFRIALDLGRRGDAARRERADGGRQPAACGCGRSPVVGALVDAGRLDEARAALRGPRRPRRRAPARQPDVPARRRARWSRSPPRSATRSGPPSSSARSSRTPTASP